MNIGDEVYIGSRLVGVWIGTNPITGSEVVYKEADNEYITYHTHQIKSKSMSGLIQDKARAERDVAVGALERIIEHLKFIADDEGGTTTVGVIANRALVRIKLWM
jgi:hypothetical protein